jgi:hypothetical protein
LPEDEPLALSITHADGRVSRWGPDEPDGKDIPNDLTFGDSIPGGHATLGTNLLRRIDIAQADENLFDDCHCYGAGGRTAWRGRLEQFPRTHGDGYGVNPGAVGYSAHLMDDPSFTGVYVDRDPNGFEDSTLARKLILAAAAISFGDFSFATNQGQLMVALPNQALGAQTVANALYRMPAGHTVGKVMYQGQTTTYPAGYNAEIRGSDDDALSTGTITSTPTLNDTMQTLTPSAARRYLWLQAYSNGTAATPAAGSNLRYSKFAVYDAHGLTTRAITGETDGLYGSDVIAHIVSNAAPLLTYTTGAGGSIEPTSFPIPHLVYRDPVTAEFAISDVNKYHLYDWGVYDNREFFYRQPNPDRLLWEARLSDGARLDADGDAGAQVFNGVFVTYTDGVTKTVGPPGGSFDDTDSALADTSSSNPWNAQNGTTPKWVPLALSFPTTLAGATAIGAAYLAERSLAGRRGTVTLTGTATHPTEGKVPCWRVRAGDWITLKDLNGAIVPRKIINKTYTHSTRTVQLQLDNTVAKLDAIMARVGVQAGIATGGGF